MDDWMSMASFGWLRRPELDAALSTAGVSGARQIGAAWESPAGVVIWVLRGRTYYMRRIETGFEIGTEEYVRSHG
jgi:hypothetical protein